MRFLGVDFGQRRLGLSLSDTSASLARPWRTIAAAGSPRQSAAAVAALLAPGGAEAEVDGEDLTDLSGIVVGLPRRLNGEDNEQTAPAREFARQLGDLAGLPVHLQDERLSSYEAEQRLATRERDWRRRKARLDAAAAAVILQDFLDARRPVVDR
jgi:putative Holliday junction resolvase